MSQLTARALTSLALPVAAKPPRAKLATVLTRLPLNGVGAKIRPGKYADRGYRADSYFQIVRGMPQSGTALAYEYWRGKLIGKPEPVTLYSRSSELWEVVERPEAPSVRLPGKLVAEAKAIKAAAAAAATAAAAAKPAGKKSKKTARAVPAKKA
ncbi:hypothetical protein GGF31_000641 [Allomyces arbusculus]|nr:hypothetical protein GGF31_000641 [Allomyces arbusculus]